MTPQELIDVKRDRFVALVEESVDFIALAELTGTVIYLNPAGRRLVGIGPDEDVRSTRISDYLPPDRVAEAQAHLVETLKTGRWSGEFEYRHVISGERLPVYCNAFVLHSPGSPPTLAQVTRDLRAAKQAERQYRELADAIPQVVWTVDLGGTPGYFNRWWYEYTGLSEADARASSWDAIVHGEDLPRLTAAREVPGSLLAATPMEIRLRAKDGTYRWNLVTLQPVRDDVGNTSKWIGIATDIDERKRAAAQHDLLSEISRRLSESLDLRVTLRSLLELLVPVYADWAIVNLPSDQDATVRTVAAYHADPDRCAALEHRFVGTTHFDRLVSRGAEQGEAPGRAVLYPAGPPDDARGGPLLATLAELGLHSAVIAPFFEDGGPAGTINLVRDGRRAPFDPDDLRLVEMVAERATAAIHNARQYEREHRVADVLQRACLPATLPSTGDVRFSGHYLPATSEALIGGDWYDAVRLPDGRFIMSIGDVAGSGLAAAVIMANMRQVVRGVAQIYADPGLMLDAADRALRVEHPDHFVTAFVAVYDPVTTMLTYASAGHPPAYLVDDHRAIPLFSPGLPLGLRDTNEQQGETVSVPPGAHLVFYTDGLIESTRDIAQGERRLIDVLERGSVLGERAPARALVDRLLPGGPQDDIAVLVATFREAGAEPERMRWRFDARDADDASRVRRELIDRLRTYRPQPDALYGSELILGELIGNVVRHTPGAAEVVLDTGAAYPVLHVIDQGEGFRHSARLPADPMSERGRGLFLIRSVARDFTVTARPGGGSHAIATLPLLTGRREPGPAEPAPG